MIFIWLIAQNQFISWSELVHRKVQSWWLHTYKIAPNILFAIIIILLFFIVARFLKKIVYKLFVHFSKSKSLAGLFSGIFSLFVMAAGIYIGLDILGLDKMATSLLAGAGIV
jgi:small conductance mechanosensitive channel